MTVRPGGRWLGFALGASVLCMPASGTARQAAPSLSAAVAQPAAFVQQHCLGCHNDRSKTAGLSLQGLSLDRRARARGDLGEGPAQGPVGRNAAAHRARQADQRRSLWRVASFLETTLDAAARANPNPGRATVHRLNRAEYSNAIRDLLAVDVKPGNWLPVDDSGYGFDNIAAVLSTSPVLIERYMSAARRVSRLAVGDLIAEALRRDLRRAARSRSRACATSGSATICRSTRAPASRFSTTFRSMREYVFKIRFRGLQPTTDDPGSQPVRGAHCRQGGPALAWA